MTPQLLREIKSAEADLIAYLQTQTSDPELTGGELSHAQRRLWILHELDPAAATYHVPVVHVIQGSLDAAALDNAFATLTARHEALRTTVRSEGGEPRQHVAD